MTAVPWNDLFPNPKNAWLTEGMQADWDDFLPLGTKEDKASRNVDVHSIFKNYSGGVKTNRDEWTWDFSREALSSKMVKFITNYNAEVDRWKKRTDKSISIDDFVPTDDTGYKWSETLKQNVVRGRLSDFNTQAVRPALYRPFCRQWLYFDRLMNERVYQMPDIFPKVETDNTAVWLKVGSELPLFALMTNTIPDLLPQGGSQCFPLYTYALDGKIRKDNITDWALGQFRDKYGPDVTKPDIFHYVYGLLHSPQYRERYKENLKRELPRVPLVGGPEKTSLPAALGSPLKGGLGLGHDVSAPNPPIVGGPCEERNERSKGVGFRAFVETGAKLAALHVGYEDADEYPLTQVVNRDVPFTWRVTKMRLSKDKTSLAVNEALTFGGIPPEAFDYKLGNRSALEWVIDQYQVGTDKRSGITSDPNRADDPEYIARLVRKVVTVSVETARLVAALPPVIADSGEAD